MATWKPIGCVTTDKVHHELVDSGSSKTLIHKCIVQFNYTPMQSDDNLHNLYKPCSFTKNCFPEFNCNMVVKEHPALVVDSKNLQYNIIFGEDFLDKCRFQLDYDIVSFDTTFHSPTLLNFFHTAITPFSSHQLMLILKKKVLAMPMSILLQHTSLLKNINKSTSMMLLSTIT